VASDPERLRRFIQEAKAASSLNHPNILTVYEIGEADSSRFIATEYVHGETPRQRMLRSRLTLREALDISIQIASALAAAHRAGVVHRDLKPENVMVREDGIVKVLDFGLAKSIIKPASQIEVDPEAATRALVNTSPGVVMGTVAYMSPEQGRGLAVDERTDIWSLGVVLYEMIAGRTPFAAETASDVLACILWKEPPSLLLYREDVPQELERIVEKALTKDMEERYQTVKDLGLDLKRLRQRQDVEAELERGVISEEGARRASARPLNGSNEQSASGVTQTADTGTARASSSAEHIVNEFKRHKRGALLILAALAVAFTAIAVAYFSRSADRPQSITSVAVLPFANVGGDPEMEYLSDGLSESLINALSQLPQLKVIARSSAFRYKGKDVDPQEVATALGVQAILVGRVAQRGDNLLVSAELVDARDRTQVWGEHYSRKASDLQAVQEEMARTISEKLRLRLSGAQERQLTKRATQNAQAYELYLKGRYYWFKFPAKEFEKSRDYFQQAIDVDPNYALAYAGLAEYYGFGAAQGFLPPSNENWSKSEAAANKALALDDVLPDAYNALAGVKQFNNDREGAERELKRAIELNPNYAEGRTHYANYLIEGGRSEEALAQIKKVLELEPLSVPYNRFLATIFYRTRRHDQAIEQYQKTLELDRNDALTHELLGDTYEQKGMQKEAVAEWSRALTLAGDSESATMIEGTFAAAGFNAAVRILWQKKLEQLKARAERGEYVPAMDYALAYTRLGDNEQAFAWLTKAEQERNGLIYAVQLDPNYDSLRSDPRFQDLMRRVGFPQ
jgi:serine/threonine-protein kinase